MRSVTLSLAYGAARDGPRAYREYRLWTMFRSHRGRVPTHPEPQDPEPQELTVPRTERWVSHKKSE